MQSHGRIDLPLNQLTLMRKVMENILIDLAFGEDPRTIGTPVINQTITIAELGERLNCCVPRDHIPLRSYALFEARSILRAVFDA